MESNSNYKRPRSRRPKNQLGLCQDCNVVLDDTNWSKSMQKYKRYSCKKCWSIRQRKYDKQTKEEKAKKTIIRKSNWTEERLLVEREKDYERQLKKNYGITLEDYYNMLEKQQGECAICGTKEPDGRGRLHVDHCHTTEKVRGLLCFTCNIMLGKAKDSIKILKSAIEYLRGSENRMKDNGKAY